MHTSYSKVVIGSQNPVKVNSTRQAFAAYFPNCELDLISISAPSGVPDQPMTASETLLGAQNRVEYCRQQIDADFYVAIEGGVDRFDYGPATFAYVVVATNQTQTVGRSAQLPLPDSVYQSLIQGQELGDVIDKLFNTTNAKQKGGAIGLFTKGLASRQSSYEQALILAMAKLTNSALFDD